MKYSTSSASSELANCNTTLSLEDLPDELFIKVFSFLETRDLICMGQMSNRIRAISHDEQLWQKINFYHEPYLYVLMRGGEYMGMKYRIKFPYSGTGIAACLPLQRIEKIPGRFLKTVINNGCKYLSLHPSEIDGKLELN